MEHSSILVFGIKDLLSDCLTLTGAFEAAKLSEVSRSHFSVNDQPIFFGMWSVSRLSPSFQSQKAFFFSFIACWISSVQTQSLGFLVGMGFEDDSDLADLTKISFSFCISLSRELKDSASPFTEESDVSRCSYYTQFFLSFRI